MKPRLFTFGCSFTAYLWPTWADILGREFDFFQNWGATGGGNQFILQSLVECHHKNQISHNDTVCIMWTNVCREDRYVDHKWILPGNIFTQDTYNKNFVRKFADIRGYYIRDLAAMWLADQILEKIGCKVYFFSMVDMINPHQYGHIEESQQISDLLEFYHPLLKKIKPSVHQIIFDLDWDSRPVENFRHTSYSLMLWRSWYNDIRDNSWPNCPNPVDFDSLPERIKKECCQQHGYENILTMINQHGKKSLVYESILKKIFQIRKKSNAPIRDSHPIPSEHLEYLQLVCTDIKISQSTVDWVNRINQLGLKGQSYDDLYIDNKTIASIPRRW